MRIKTTEGQISKGNTREIRKLTVSRLSQGPAVRLTGKWLSQLGFEAGVRVVVETGPGRLVLTIDSGRY